MKNLITVFEPKYTEMEVVVAVAGSNSTNGGWTIGKAEPPKKYKLPCKVYATGIPKGCMLAIFGRFRSDNKFALVGIIPYDGSINLTDHISIFAPKFNSDLLFSYNPDPGLGDRVPNYITDNMNTETDILGCHVRWLDGVKRGIEK